MGAASKQTVMSLVVASLTRTLSGLFPGYYQTSPKHRHWYDFGFPDDIIFEQHYTMYRRNSIARAMVCKPVYRVWQDFPWLQEREETHDETPLEKEIRLEFERLQFWSRLKMADERARVGAYGGVIFRFRDSKPFSEPVERVPGGLKGLAEIIPVFEGQLKPLEYDENETSETYGQPTKYQFLESEVGQANTRSRRNVVVHPDRVHIWSPDMTVNGESCLEAAYNDLVTIEKVIGAGGEGFWKNARMPMHMDLDKDASPEALATMLGVQVSELADKLDEVVEDFDKGFDQKLMTQGIEAKNLTVQLTDPKEFFMAALQSAAASVPIPVKVLIGNITGERASSEDLKDWDETCMSRRNQIVVPNIRSILERLMKYGVLKEKDWHLDWTDLTAASEDDKINRAGKMADINQKMLGTGERVYTADEIREATGHEPLSDDEKALEDELPDDVDDDEAE